jgi:hypothetical protein
VIAALHKKIPLLLIVWGAIVFFSPLTWATDPSQLTKCINPYVFKLSPPFLSNISTGETVTIKYGSIGCFHAVSYDFIFKGANPTTVDLIEHPPVGYGESVHLGTCALKDTDLYRLDLLIAFYRNIQDGGCTTEDRIYILWNDRSEFVTDRTCDVDDLMDILSLPDLAHRIKEMKFDLMGYDHKPNKHKPN